MRGFTFEDALELALMVIEDEKRRSKNPAQALERIEQRLRYYLTLVKERKFERLRYELGAIDI